MIDKILTLEKTARLLEPSNLERTHLNKLVNEYANEFIDNIETTKAFHVDEKQGSKILLKTCHQKRWFPGAHQRRKRTQPAQEEQKQSWYQVEGR